MARLSDVRRIFSSSARQRGPNHSDVAEAQRVRNFPGLAVCPLQGPAYALLPSAAPSSRMPSAVVDDSAAAAKER